MNNSLNLYPNPTTGIVFIQVSNELIDKGYKVVDAIGKQIVSSHIASEFISLDLTHLENGVYILEIPSVNYSARIIKE